MLALLDRNAPTVVGRQSERLTPRRRWQKLQKVITQFPFLWAARQEWGALEEVCVRRIDQEALLQTLNGDDGIQARVWMYGFLAGIYHVSAEKLIELPVPENSLLMDVIRAANLFRDPWTPQTLVLYRFGTKPDRTPLISLTVYKRPVGDNFITCFASEVGAWHDGLQHRAKN